MKFIAMFAICGSYLSLVSCSNADGDDELLETLGELSDAYPAVSRDTWPEGTVLNCFPETGVTCASGKCSPMEEIAVSFQLEPATSVYRRCDAGGGDCNEVPVELSYSGAFLNVTNPGKSNFAKYTGSDRFVDVAADFDTIFIYHGRCERGLKRGANRESL